MRGVIEKLFREPQGGKQYPFLIFIGCLILLGLGQVIVGVGVISFSAAELLAKPKTRAASLLRFLAIALYAVSLSTVVAALWLYLV